LAPDAGFETDPSSGGWYTYGPGQFSWSGNTAHTGGHSVAVTNTGEGLSRWLTNTRAIAVAPGTTVNASVFLKTAAVRDRAYLTLTFFDAATNYISGSATDSSVVAGTHDWTPVSLHARAPAGAAYTRIEIRLAGLGTVWADDVTVTTG
jgi:hypothetical protein